MMKSIVNKKGIVMANLEDLKYSQYYSFNHGNIPKRIRFNAAVSRYYTKTYNPNNMEDYDLREIALLYEEEHYISNLRKNIWLYHNDSKPAKIIRESKPKKRSDRNWIFYREFWYKFGKLHRIDGPAVTLYKIPGNHLLSKPIPVEQAWYVDDKQHREDGPALIRYNIHNKICYTEWYLNGVDITDSAREHVLNNKIVLNRDTTTKDDMFSIILRN